ncbi:hypothetical protein RCL_jg2740.t1 [Rhizophagus clarus]|uniref:Uncharacterized protein n=1 Tax=Rhizophagus clarus TaxID=94130 RepID=A0A8H3M8N9_9GLOM|nr:hypothetical protein RCL_jg2740.t1 [Rhizophagus clarus]
MFNKLNIIITFNSWNIGITKDPTSITKILLLIGDEKVSTDAFCKNLHMILLGKDILRLEKNFKQSRTLLLKNISSDLTFQSNIY